MTTETILWQVGKNIWECNNCNGLILTSEPEKYNKCSMCDTRIMGILTNVTEQFIKKGVNNTGL